MGVGLEASQLDVQPVLHIEKPQMKVEIAPVATDPISEQKVVTESNECDKNS